ncbi:MAG: ribosomal L7Ae/L30e/S12e/Gadd45 family protein [Firmicutes bacterium]|nr:ribosomal L7Ae/L30e/S12e/Gadd45 family protein [Alicyclobacillaceae bacterium]MCL6497957.1 ribosomal L7Ae/L30e/S12e/Gadd45 family protein [Bacillota bacterium]
MAVGPEEALRDPRRRVVGARETLKRVLAGDAQRVWVAKDADPAVVAEVIAAATSRQIPLHYVDTMAELGQWCGIQVKAACAAETVKPRR